MIPNPAYLASEEYAQEREWAKDALVARRDCPEDYFPEDYDKKLPDEGAWIMLLMSVHVGKPLDNGRHENITVPHLSIWFATPTVTTHSTEITPRYKRGKLNIAASQAIIQTPQGAVHIWPREYTVIKDISKYLEFTEEDGLYMHFLNPDADGFDEIKLLYIRSRGISLAEARRMLLPELKNPHFCYFTFDPKVSEVFPEGTGMPYLVGRRA